MYRTAKRILAILIPAAALLSACGGQPNRDDEYVHDQPYSDARIHDEVHETLANSEQLRDDYIEVKVEDGDVILAGEVDSHEEAALAHDLAHGVEGVDDVYADDLEVEY